MKSEIFQKILEVVSEKCEVSPEKICGSSKPTEVLHARTKLIWYCNDYGLCANDIAKFIHKKRTATVYGHLANYHIYKRSSVTFRILTQEIADKLSAIFPKTLR